MKFIYLSICIIVYAFIQAKSQDVQIDYDKNQPRLAYAAKVLEKSLILEGYRIVNDNGGYIIFLKTTINELHPEEYAIDPEIKTITIKGGDDRGVIYGSLSLAELIRNGTLLGNIKYKTESAKLPFRAIKYDLPWDTYRHSYSLTQHQEVCSSLEYWEVFLDMMVSNRFNTLTLWNLHPYSFMIRPKNYPEATPFNEGELKNWQNLFQGIFKMAAERGIDTYLVPFNIFVSPEFSKAHNVATDNLEHHFFVRGDTSEIVKQYTRECVTQTLEEYPELSGFGLTLGEGMAGMTPQQRENWMKETIIAGMRLANRKSKLIHRIPFSSTTGSLSATSIEMEQITRKGIEQEATMDFIEGPVWADLKFNWSHGHSTPKLIKVHGGKLYGSYFKPEPKGYKIIWTVRNEDFFCLRWGVPDFIKKHIAMNSPSYVGGYLIGSETYIPAKDYFTKPEDSVSWKYAFQRQWLFYMLWGRLLYNPQTQDEIFKQEFINRYGKEAGILLDAYALSSSTQLRIVSSFDCGWDFTMYSEGFIALDPVVKRVDFISVDRLINQKPLDTTIVSITEYVKNISVGKTYSSEWITPINLADILERDCREALGIVSHLKIVVNNDLIQEIADIKVWANLGLYFSEKLKGAVALETYRKTSNPESKMQAIKHLEKALVFWDEIIKLTEHLYNEMPLVHFSEQDGKPWQENDHIRFHWKTLRNAVENDIVTAQKAL